MLRKAVRGVEGSNFPEELHKGLWFNVVSITRGWVGVKFQGKKRYVTLEWPLKLRLYSSQNVHTICQNNSDLTLESATVPLL